ncbi:MAG: Stk1 family PASTA domain-containing Ser/Thr kinase [Acidimicrobiales bacterium]
MPTITESIGRVLSGRYRIEAALGSGTSAHVFAAWDVKLNRRVALKVLHPSLHGDSAFLRRFRSEAQAAASLSHPNIVAVYDWGEHAGGPFLVLEYLAGGSLRDVLDAGRRLTPAQAVAVGIDAADGLAFAHGRGFVHRDVKPANLLFGDDGRLRVADFGLARALAEASFTEPVGATVGTARYVAPEQAQGRPVDGRADVYALALVLYESITGIVPFAADTLVGTLMARVDAHLPGHDLLGPLAGVLGDAAAPVPEERLDAEALSFRLRRLADNVGREPPMSLIMRNAGPLAVGAGTLGRHPWSPAAPPPGTWTDATEHGIVGKAESDDDAEGATAGSKLSAPRGRARSSHGEGGHRRISARIGAGVLAVLVLLGAVAYAAVAAKVFVPSHRVVALAGDSEQGAAAALAREHFTLRVLRRRTSTTVPAGHVIRQTPGAGTTLKEGAVVEVVLSSGPPPVSIPNLSSVTGGCTQVAQLLTGAHFKDACSAQNSTTLPSGAVISVSPAGGQAPYGSTVTVVVSSGLPEETFPSLAGSTCQAATATLAAVHLTASCANVYSTTVPSGQVVNSSPTGQAPYGSTVTVNVSQGPPPVVIPNVIGDTVPQAIEALQAAGLNPQSDQGPLGGHVFATNPNVGTSVPQGTAITLYSR